MRSYRCKWTSSTHFSFLFLLPSFALHIPSSPISLFLRGLSGGFLTKSVSTARVAYTLRGAPESTPLEQQHRSDVMRCEILGSGIFLAGFLVWNLDNMWVSILLRLSLLGDTLCLIKLVGRMLFFFFFLLLDFVIRSRTSRKLLAYPSRLSSKVMPGGI